MFLEIFEKLKFIFTSKVFQFNETINEIGYYDLQEIKENFKIEADKASKEASKFLK